MTMSRIDLFTIDQVNLGIRGGAEEDSLMCYSVIDFSLEKTLLCPNEFRFTLKRHHIEKTDKTVKFSIASEILGKPVKCTVSTSLKGFNSPQNSDYKFTFEGTIVSAAIKGLEIKCVALSNDYELSVIPHCRYYMDKTLEEIVKDIWKGGGRKQDHIKPYYDKTIPYVVQYNETDYDFLVRLAKQYGEFFYFEETQGLVFGMVPDTDTLDLKRKDDFSSLQYDLTCGDPNLAYTSYHYAKEGIIHSTVSAFDDGENLYSISKNASSDPTANIDLYYDYPNALPFNANADYLTHWGDLWKGGEGASFVVCRCTTYRLDIHVGSFIKLIEQNQNNGDFIVTKVQLNWDCNGSPVNEITALGISSENVYDLNAESIAIIPPYVDINAYPKSSPQRAIVVDNVDPLKLGRVMVRFAWQDVGKANYAMPANEDERKKYPWIRIAQPYGGNMKGCYILPEIDEEVMVGFEHGNMEKPFVIGTLYHDSSQDAQKQLPHGKWVETNDANKENEVKAFRTKKGHTIEFHDTKEGDGFIRIYNRDMSVPPDQEPQPKPNYEIVLSTDKIQKMNGNQKEDYKVKSADEAANPEEDINEKADYTAGKLRIMVRSNGGDIMLDAGDGDIIMNAKNIRVNATGNATSLVKGKNVLKVEGDQLIDVGSNSMVVQREQKVLVKGDDKKTCKKKADISITEAVKLTAKSLETKTDNNTTVKAESLSTDSTGSTSIKGKTIEANARQDFKVTAVKETSIHATQSAEFISQSVKIQGTTTQVIGLSSFDLTTPKGTRKGLWQDL